MVVKDQQNRGNKDFFSILIPEALGHKFLALLLWAYGKVECHSGESHGENFSSW